MKIKLTKKTKKVKGINLKQVNKQNIKINISLAKSKKYKKKTSSTPSIFIPMNTIPSYPLFIDQPAPQPIHHNNEPIKESVKIMEPIKEPTKEPVLEQVITFKKPKSQKAIVSKPNELKQTAIEEFLKPPPKKVSRLIKRTDKANDPNQILNPVTNRYNMINLTKK